MAIMKMNTQNKKRLLQIISFSLSGFILFISALGLLLITGLAGYVVTAVYADESIANQRDLVVVLLVPETFLFLVYLHMTLSSYYRFKRYSSIYLENIFDWIGEKTDKKVTEKKVIEFMRDYGKANDTSEVPYREIKKHFKKYSEDDVVDCITNMMSEGIIAEPEVDVLKIADTLFIKW